MLHYVENRVWPLFATINEFAGQTVEVDTKFCELGRLSLQVERVQSQVDHYGDLASNLAITFPDEVIAKIAAKITDRHGLTLKKLRLLFTDYGFLSLASHYEAGRHADFAQLEKAGMKIVDDCDEAGIFNLVEALIDRLVTLKALQKSTISHLGLPPFVDDRTLAESGYLYNQHIIAHRSEAARFDTIGNFFTLEEDVRVSQGWSLFFWVLDREDILARFEGLVFIDTLCLAESCLYNSAQRCYIFILDKVIRDEKRCKPEQLRNFFLNNNLHFQKIRLAERNMTEAQANYLHLYRQNSKLDEKYTLYKDGEDYIRYSVDGLESSMAEKSNRIIQFILAILTCLTLYSIVNDIHSFIVSEDLVVSRFVEQSGKSAMLAIVTLLIFALMSVFRSSLKK